MFVFSSSATALSRRFCVTESEYFKPVCCLNILEMYEVVSVLRGQGKEDVKKVVLTMASEMLSLSDAGKGKTRQELINACEGKIKSGEAFERFGN